jgi:Transposase
MTTLIESVSQGVPKALNEIITLGRTLTKRAVDVLAYFDRPGTSNGPTEAIKRPPRTPPRLRPRLPKPDQLHRPITARNRRLQTPTTN